MVHWIKCLPSLVQYAYGNIIRGRLGNISLRGISEVMGHGGTDSSRH